MSFEKFINAMFGREPQYAVQLNQPVGIPAEDPRITEKREKALEYLGERHLLKGGNWSRYPTVLKQE